MYTKPLSYSSLSLYYQCPKLWARTYIDGVRDAPGPAAERGTRIHQMLEDFFNGKNAYPAGNPVLGPWQSRIEALQQFGPTAEGEIAALPDWRPTHFGNPLALLRGAVDLRYENGPAYILDWKTGKKYASHVEQGEVYVALAPEDAEDYVVQFYYLDQPFHVDEWKYNQAGRLALREKWAEKAIAVREATEYPATPGEKCTYCPLSWRNGGECKRAR